MNLSVNELYAALDKAINPSLSCKFDNDGLMCCPCGDEIVRKVIVSLDVNEKIIDIAIAEGAQAIVAHHPMMLFGVKSVIDGDVTGRRIIRLVKNNIAAMSFHTRLDAAQGGVGDEMCRLLELRDVSGIAAGCDGSAGCLARVGNLSEEAELDEFVGRVKSIFAAQSVEYTDAGKKVYRVAVCGGSGKEFIADAAAAGADTYVTGEVGYHAINDAADLGMNIIAAGHFQTENPICAILGDMIKNIDGSIEVIYASSLERKTV